MNPVPILQIDQRHLVICARLYIDISRYCIPVAARQPIPDDVVNDAAVIVASARLPETVECRSSVGACVIVDAPQSRPSGGLLLASAVIAPCEPFGVILRGSDGLAGCPCAHGRSRSRGIAAGSLLASGPVVAASAAVTQATAAVFKLVGRVTGGRNSPVCGS